MVDFDHLPKLLHKQDFEEYSQRDKEDKLTSEDLDNRLEAFEWIITTYTSDEFKKFKCSEKN